VIRQLRLRESVQQAIRACIELHNLTQEGRHWNEKTLSSERVLASHLTVVQMGMAELVAPRVSNARADEKHPGFIILKSGRSRVRVPYHLAEDFPRGDRLRALLAMANGAKVSAQGVVCLSGSTALWRALRYVADLDFCEYVPDKGHASLWRDVRKKLAKPRENLVPIDGKEYLEDGTPNELSDQSESASPLRTKLAFLASVLTDVVEATNMILPVRGTDPTDPMWQKSFVFQEAPIASGSWIPRTLSEPVDLGGYVKWLRMEIRERLKDQNIVKAAKRGLSLARIFGLGKRGTRLTALMRNCTDLVQNALQARRDLDSAIVRLETEHPELAERFVSAQRATVARLQRASDARRRRLDKKGAQGDNSVVRELEAELNSLLDNTGDSQRQRQE